MFYSLGMLVGPAPEEQQQGQLLEVMGDKRHAERPGAAKEGHRQQNFAAIDKVGQQADWYFTDDVAKRKEADQEGGRPVIVTIAQAIDRHQRCRSGRGGQDRRQSRRIDWSNRCP